MEQLELLKVPEPCRGVCQSDSKGYCLGCMRNRDERFVWQKLSPAQKLYVLKLCQRRFARRRQQASAGSQTTKPSDSEHTGQIKLPV